MNRTVVVSLVSLADYQSGSAIGRVYPSGRGAGGSGGAAGQGIGLLWPWSIVDRDEIRLGHYFRHH